MTEKDLLQFYRGMSYWKGHQSVIDVLSSELSYSLIYDNIRPDKVDEALATVGLAALPNRFFLIQVDDYQNYANKLKVTQEFFQKTKLIKILRACLRERSLEGFAGNMIGLDNILCFLCCEECEADGGRELLLSLAEEFKKRIHARSPYTISVCISQRCTQLEHYSKMYPRMSLALSKTYFIGKEVSLFLEPAQGETPPAQPEADARINDCFPELLVAIARHNPEQFEKIFQSVLENRLAEQGRPQRVKLELIRLMQRIEEYCLRCGVPEKRIHSFNENAMNQILSCSFISDASACFRDYYEQVSQILAKYETDADYSSFKAPVEEYVAEHFREEIRLKDVAATLWFSEGHFARTFRKQFGTTFVRYLTEYRIEQSKALLRQTHIPIEQIALRVGVNSYSYFCTCFKRSCGISPGAYRKQGENGADMPPVSPQGQNIETKCPDKG